MVNLSTQKGKEFMRMKFETMFENLSEDSGFYSMLNFKKTVAFSILDNHEPKYNLDIEISERSSCDKMIKKITKENPFSQFAAEFSTGDDMKNFIIQRSIESLEKLGCEKIFLNDTDIITLKNDSNSITISSEFGSDLGVYLIVCNDYCLNRLDRKINYDMAKYIGSVKGEYDIIDVFNKVSSLNGDYGIFVLGNLIIFSNKEGKYVI